MQRVIAGVRVPTHDLAAAEVQDQSQGEPPDNDLARRPGSSRSEEDGYLVIQKEKQPVRRSMTEISES